MNGIEKHDVKDTNNKFEKVKIKISPGMVLLPSILAVRSLSSKLS